MPRGSAAAWIPGRTGLLLLCLAVASASVGAVASAQAPSTGAGGGAGIPGGLVPDPGVAPGPVGSTGAEHKFDGGFYEKIQGLMLEEPQEGDFGVYDGERYYSVIMVVSRDDGDGRDPDETAEENKAAVVKRLEKLGAREIQAAESLSFVTASIPVADVPGFSLHDEVYRMGDGELAVTPSIDIAKHTVHSTSADLRRSVSSVPNGDGVVVAIVDTGIRSTYMTPKVTDRTYCSLSGCLDHSAIGMAPEIAGYDNDTGQTIASLSSHGTKMAQIIAASTLSSNNGVSPRATLLDAMYAQDPARGGFATNIIHAIDWSYGHGADVVNLSLGAGRCNFFSPAALELVVNEAVDKGMVAVIAAGNRGPEPNTIDVPACAHNALAVGGINDRVRGAIEMWVGSSRGPAGDSTMLPHIVAPAEDIMTLAFPTNATMRGVSGTSASAALTSGAAALMLGLEPDMTPAEVKVALLLGADWQGPVPCTSSQYETSNPRDNCSHARQPRGSAAADGVTSMGILNSVGFGIMNVSASLGYAHSSEAHIVSDHLGPGTASRQYRFTVSSTAEPVKVILGWLAHPHGGIAEQAARGGIDVFVADLGFTVKSGRDTWRAESDNQTSEFVVFTPPRTGTYTVEVTGSGLDRINKPVQNFVLGGTLPLTPVVSASNSPPVAQDRTMVVSPGIERAVRLSATDSDGDSVSFHTSREPRKGDLSTDEFIARGTSSMLYTPHDNFRGSDTFQVTPSDGRATGNAATVTLVAERLPPGSSVTAADPRRAHHWDTLSLAPVEYNSDGSATFDGRDYFASAMYMESSNAEGAELSIRASNGNTYTAAVPPSGVRMIEFDPITIRSVTLSTDGVEEEAAQQLSAGGDDIPDARVAVGYVPAPTCPAQAASERPACPVPTYRIVTGPEAAIPDRTRSQDAYSTANVPLDGIISSISVDVDIAHTWISDITVVLTSPGGTEVVLHNRTGGSADDIDRSFGSSGVQGLADLIGTGMAGDWTLSVGDYVAGDVGEISEWGMTIEYARAGAPTTLPTSPTIEFFDDFESGLGKWAKSGELDWTISTSPNHHVPVRDGASPSNKVLHADDCDTRCIVGIASPVDLTGYLSAELSFWRHVDRSIEFWEYLKVDLYDGDEWITVEEWNLGNEADSTWHYESYDLAPYIGIDDFSVRFVTFASYYPEDMQVDDVKISGTSVDTSVVHTIMPSPPPPQSTSGLCGLYVSVIHMDFPAVDWGYVSGTVEQRLYPSGSVDITGGFIEARPWTGGGQTYGDAVTQVKLPGGNWQDLTSGVSVPFGRISASDRGGLPMEMRLDLTEYDSGPKVGLRQSILYLATCS